MLITLLFSCQTIRIEKRVYSKGYAIFWKGNGRKSKESISTMNPIIEQSTTIVRTSDTNFSTSHGTLDSLPKGTLIPSQKSDEFFQSTLPTDQEETTLNEVVHETQSLENCSAIESEKQPTQFAKSPSQTDDPRILPTWLRITIISLIIAGLFYTSIAILALSFFTYFEFGVFLAIATGATLGYIFFFLGFWAVFAISKRESQRNVSVAKKAALWALFGIALGFIWGLGFLADFSVY